MKYPKNKGFSTYKIGKYVFIDYYDNIFKKLKYKNIEYDNYIVDIVGNVYDTNTKSKVPTIKTNNGYVAIRLKLYTTFKKWFLLHRIVASTFIDNPDNLPQVDHVDGNKENNSVENLDWVSDKENKIRAVKTGLFHSEFDHYISKFTEEKMDKLWNDLLYTNISFRDLAKKYGVEPSIIRSIYIGKTYKNYYNKYKDKKPMYKDDNRLRRKYSTDDIISARKLYREGKLSANKIENITGVPSYYLIKRVNSEYYSKLYDSIK